MPFTASAHPNVRIFWFIRLCFLFFFGPYLQPLILLQSFMHKPGEYSHVQTDNCKQNTATFLFSSIRQSCWHCGGADTEGPGRNLCSVLPSDKPSNAPNPPTGSSQTAKHSLRSQTHTLKDVEVRSQRRYIMMRVSALHGFPLPLLWVLKSHIFSWPLVRCIIWMYLLMLAVICLECSGNWLPWVCVRAGRGGALATSLSS